MKNKQEIEFKYPSIKPKRVRKTNKPKIGDYVLLTYWADADVRDPWAVGILEKVLSEHNKFYYKVKTSSRWFKHCFKITKEQGKEIIELAEREGHAYKGARSF